MSQDEFGTTGAAGTRPTRGRWYQFSLSSLLYVVLLIAAGAGGLHALRTQCDLRDVRQRFADTSAELVRSAAELDRTSAAFESSRTHTQAMTDDYESLRTRLIMAEELRASQQREAKRLSTKLTEAQSDPALWLLHEEQQLVREHRQLQAKREPAAAAAQRRDLSQAKDRDARRQFLERLDLRFNFLYSGALDEVVKNLAEQSNVPIVIQPDDLAEAQIPRIRNTKVRCNNATVEQALSQAVIWANTNFVRSLQDPRLELVYVLSEPGQADPARLIVTTRKRAAQRGWLPENFVPAPAAE